MLLIVLVFAKILSLQIASAHFLTQDFIHQYLINNGPLKPCKRCPRLSVPGRLATSENSNNAISFGNSPCNSGLQNIFQDNNVMQNMPSNLPAQSANNLNNLPLNLPTQSFNNVPFNRLLANSNSMNNGQPLNNFVPSNGFQNLNNVASGNGLPNANNIQNGNACQNVNNIQYGNALPNINNQFGNALPNTNNLAVGNGLPNVNNLQFGNALPNLNSQFSNALPNPNNLAVGNGLPNGNNILLTNGCPVNTHYIPTNNIMPNCNGQLLNGLQNINNFPTGNGFLNGNNVPPTNFLPNTPSGTCNNLMPNINTNVNNLVTPNTPVNNLPSSYNLPINNFVSSNNLPLNNIVPSGNNVQIPNGFFNLPQNSLPSGIQNPFNVANQLTNNCNCLPNVLSSYNNLPIVNQGPINNFALPNAQPNNIASLPSASSNMEIANGLQVSSIQNPFSIANNVPVQTYNPYQNLSYLPGSSITNSVSFINPAINTGRLINDGLAVGAPVNELSCNNLPLNNNMPVDFSLANLPVKRNILQNEWSPMTGQQIENQEDLSNHLNFAKELANKLIIEGFGNLPIFNGLPVAGITETVTVLNNPCECS